MDRLLAYTWHQELTNTIFLLASDHGKFRRMLKFPRKEKLILFVLKCTELIDFCALEITQLLFSLQPATSDSSPGKFTFSALLWMLEICKWEAGHLEVVGCRAGSFHFSKKINYWPRLKGHSGLTFIIITSKNTVNVARNHQKVTWIDSRTQPPHHTLLSLAWA